MDDDVRTVGVGLLQSLRTGIDEEPIGVGLLERVRNGTGRHSNDDRRSAVMKAMRK